MNRRIKTLLRYTLAITTLVLITTLPACLWLALTAAAVQIGLAAWPLINRWRSCRHWPPDDRRRARRSIVLKALVLVVSRAVRMGLGAD
ncbi:hypothetical protein [Marinimicrobium sp. ABcell2]|uniref:hypothetical protein n=1 Tax=Marinimicrobium sp. ABcell2 TaxID=3069751 RepID=UPI0027B262D5|nr:hypothetical protein [Marinimicrobium sp. ABcell2]MDQ2077546.1 hypothetical protein [Marinimicrobium sp. ABcell2]